MKEYFFPRQKSFRNLTEGKCLSVSLNFILFFHNNTTCFLPGWAKDLSALPSTVRIRMIYVF